MDKDIWKIEEILAEKEAEKEEIRRNEAYGDYLTRDRRPDAAFRKQYGPNWRSERKPKQKSEGKTLSEISDEELEEIIGIDEE